ncbi:MAG: hypothetical protein IJU76_01450 [Desulfovibrionaceae bacterium]|nr:hypothetical protein [Desulfovibrionaceae bacterium]
MIDSNAINWKKNYCEELRNDLQFLEEMRNDLQFREVMRKDLQFREMIRKDLREEMKDELREEIDIEWIQEAKQKAKREDALVMLHKGFSHTVIGEITKLPLEEIEKLQAQRV